MSHEYPPQNPHTNDSPDPVQVWYEDEDFPNVPPYEMSEGPLTANDYWNVTRPGIPEASPEAQETIHEPDHKVAKRPLSVTIVCTIQIVASVLVILAGCLLVALNPLVGGMLFLACAIGGGVDIFIAVKMLQGSRTARIVFVVLLAVSILATLMREPGVGSFLGSLLSFVYAIILFTPQAEDFFRADNTGSPHSSQRTKTVPIHPGDPIATNECDSHEQ